MSNLVVLRNYPDRLHAELACSYLESEGIDAVISSPAESSGDYGIAEWGEGGAPHELKVAEVDQAAAEAALAETEGTDWDRDDDAVAPPPAPTAVAESTPPTTTTTSSAQDVGETPGTCPACGGDPERSDKAIVLSVKGSVWGCVAYVLISLAFLPFTKAINVWLAISILGMIIPVVLFVVRGFFVRARCGLCDQLRMPKAKAKTP